MAYQPTLNPQPSKITNASATIDTGIEPFGALQVNTGFQTLFYDSWSTALDTVDKWTVTGNAPAITNGNMVMSPTGSSYNAIRTKDNVRPNVGFSLVRNGISIETAAATGAGRFWGLGTPATTPLPMSLVQDGIGFEIDQLTGDLLAVTYVAGTRTTIATLTRPIDGLIHAYGCYFRVTQAYWILDGVTVATKSFPNLQAVELPAIIVRQNAAAFTGTPAFVNIAHLTADTSRQGFLISDPIIGTRQARVGADGGLKISLTQRATYRASTAAVLIPAVTSPNPFFTIYGSATKTIKVHSITISGLTLTAVAYLNIGLRKYSTAVTAGTSTALTKVPLDSASVASTATNVNAYTAVPTAGTTVGDISSRRVIGQATTAAAAGITQVVDFDFTTGSSTEITLRGIAEGIGLYWVTAPATAVSMLLRVEYTEE